MAGLLAVLTGCVERYFFYPDAERYAEPAQFGLAAEDVHVPAADGARLHGWWLPAASGVAKGTVLHLHGNAANISNHLPLVAWLPAAGFNVLTIDYRGFGRSEGAPTLEGVVADGRAALDWLRRRPEVDGERLIILGQSLGGATAIRALAEDGGRGVRLLVVDSAFASYRGIAREAAAQSPVLALLAPAAVRSLPGERLDPAAAMARLDTPVLIVHGTADATIPYGHAERLYAAARGVRELMRVDGGAHIDALLRPNVRGAVLRRMEMAVAGARPGS